MSLELLCALPSHGTEKYKGYITYELENACLLSINKEVKCDLRERYNGDGEWLTYSQCYLEVAYIKNGTIVAEYKKYRVLDEIYMFKAKDRAAQAGLLVLSAGLLAPAAIGTSIADSIENQRLLNMNLSYLKRQPVCEGAVIDLEDVDTHAIPAE